MTVVPANRYFIFVLIAFTGFAFDVYSKNVVFDDLGYPAGVRVPTKLGAYEVFSQGDSNGRSDQYLDGWISFRLHTSFNRGALWGMGQDKTWLFAALSVIAALGVLFWLFKIGAAKSLWLTICLGLILSGTLGNLWDRLAWHGYRDGFNGEQLHAVRDFLLFTFGTYDWPVFNFADVFLVTGAIMLGGHSFLISDEENKTEQLQQTSESIS